MSSVNRLRGITITSINLREEEGEKAFERIGCCDSVADGRASLE
jgi:hypothetical protein